MRTAYLVAGVVIGIWIDQNYAVPSVEVAFKRIRELIEARRKN